MKNICLLGSTGSIGTQTLDIVRAYPERLCVKVLAASKNVSLIEKQIREFHPEVAVLFNEECAKELKEKVADTNVRVLAGMDGLIEAVALECVDTVVTAVVGMIGIRPTIAAIKAGKNIALANKETLVTAGHIIMPLVKEKKVSLLPVDSEHSAIFQSLQGNPEKAVEKIILTASGGPFRGMKKEELANKTVEDALKHPNWSMGQKITVDSATLVNKALEVMEAKWLFGVSLEQIEVVIHPQSILHSGVMYHDGALIGQMGLPDMKLPIQYALFYPDRLPMDGKRLDLFALGQLTFERPDPEAFGGFKMGMQAAKMGGSMPTVYNAANEKAVAMFLHKAIKFPQIAEIIEDCMSAHTCIQNPSVEEILAAEQETYDRILGRLGW